MTQGRAAQLIDTHCHLNHPRLLRRLDDVLARARGAGVSDAIVVGYDLPSSRAAVDLASLHDGLWASVGIHPHDAKDLTESDFAEIGRLARSPRVVAIGETGLDFYRDLSPRHAQAEAFERHLDLAVELNLPTIIHCRDAQDAVLETLSARRQGGLIWHCFDGTPAHAERAAALGMMLGFGGRVTYRSAHELRGAAAQALLDRILLETDAPYLSPEPHRSGDNEPANLPLIAEAVAAARGDTPAHLIAAASENAKRVFRIAEGSQ
jgi:TatD DNase family protein